MIKKYDYLFLIGGVILPIGIFSLKKGCFMLELNSELGNLKRFLDYVHEVAENAGCSDLYINQLELVTEEAVVNVMNYAYPNGDGMIQLFCKVDNSSFSIELSDSGTPFNPLGLHS